MHLRLPPGYYAHLDPDVLVLLGRADGSVVGRFNGRRFVAEEVERAAWEDYGTAAGWRISPNRAPSGRRPPASRPRSDLWPPRPPS